MDTNETTILTRAAMESYELRFKQHLLNAAMEVSSIGSMVTRYLDGLPQATQLDRHTASSLLPDEASELITLRQQCADQRKELSRYKKLFADVQLERTP